MGNKSRSFLKESPKVGTLLLLGAVVLFPMYMMFSISLMTPAQLERFPWFPLPIDIPEQIDSVREGRVTVRPAAIEVTPQGQAAERIVIPPDPRFQLNLPGADIDELTYQVEAAADKPVVTAELQAANVWEVRPAGDGSFTVDNAPFEPPPGFESVLPGLRVKARVQREVQRAENAYRRSRTALRVTDRIYPSVEESRRDKLELDAVVGFIEARAMTEAATRAVERAHGLADDARRWNTSVDQEIADAENRLRIARINVGRLEGRVEGYFTRHEETARRRAEMPDDEPVPVVGAFKVVRREPVAVLLADKPTTVAKDPGLLAVETVWRYDVDRKRLLRVVPRPEAPLGAEPRDAVPGRPLADLLAARDIDLVWEDNLWLHDDRPFHEQVPAGFDVLLPNGSADGDARHIAAGTVLATITEPRVQAVVSGDTLRVGLALRQDDDTFRMPLGPGRWVYSLRSDRDTPFAVRSVVPKESRLPLRGEADTTESARDYEVDPAYTGRVGEFFVNRQRTVEGTWTDGWKTVGDNVALSVPPGFKSDLANPRAEQPVTRVLADDMLLGVLTMPRATVQVTDGFLIVRMTGSAWSDGQWEYPLGDEDSLQVRLADLPRMKGGGPWRIPARSDEEQAAWDDALDRLAEARKKAADAQEKLDDAEIRDDEAARRRARELIEAATVEVRAAEAVAPADTILEILAIRRATLEYIGQRWRCDGRPVDLWLNPDVLKRSRAKFLDAETTLRNLQRRRREYARRPAVPLTEAEAAAREAMLREIDRKAADAARALEVARREVLRAEKAAGFVPLAGKGDVLSPETTRVVVEPGTVLARLCAETPHPDIDEEHGGAPLATNVRRDGDEVTVEFSHRLPLPVRANVLVTEDERVAGGQKLATYFRSQWFDLDNFKEAWVYVRPFILNTVFVAVVTMILSLLFASLSAFVFSRFDFPGKGLFYAMIIILLMIPGVLNLVPLYVVVKNMHLLNSLWALILPAIAGGQVMNVYIMRNNLETLAKDLFDAAKIDGASNLQTYWHIAIPLSRPIMGTLAIFALLSQWNNFIWPWIVLRDMEKMTITAGLAKLEGQHLSDYGLQMGGAVLASLPLIVLFFFTMNLFIRGMQSGAIKA